MDKLTSLLFPIFVLLTGLSISAVAAWYSIIGLTTIFSGAIMAVAIMGSALEVGKLVTVAWLHSNWKIVPWLMKTYLLITVVTLMFITSMGIFGFLSKAHIEQTATSGNSGLQIELLDTQIARKETKISREQKKIDDANTVISQLDNAVDVLIKFDRIRGPTGSIATRQKQKEERAELNRSIDDASEKMTKSGEGIADLQDRKFLLEKKQVAFEVEVGPIKYIAELIYGAEEAKELMDEAVRTVIIILIFVFDPLAVLLLLAANISFEQIKKKKEELDVKSEKQKTVPSWDETMDEHVSILAKQIGEEIDKDILNDLLGKEPREPSAESLEEMPELTEEQFKTARRNPYVEEVKKSGINHVPYVMENVKEKTIYEADDEEAAAEHPGIDYDMAVKKALSKISDNASISVKLDNDAGRLLSKEIKLAISEQSKTTKEKKS